MLNTPGVVVDLRTGKLRPPADFMTKMTAVAPDGKCTRWLAFLDRITGRDADLINYLQRVIGYALTGEIKEHAIFFGHGTGANGKSVLISTISGIMGDYHKATSIETFTASKFDRHPTEVAALQGARLVTASETERGRQWAESRIKELTGGDLVTARFMRQDFFEYRPQFKLFIAGNHTPGLGGVDEAMRRRFHMIPFSVTIPKPERDTDLVEKLKAEWPGILAWAIRGCLMWRALGLQKPKAVVEASEAYLEAEDAVGTWINEKCERRPHAWTASADLFASWSAWAKSAGEEIGSQKAFTEALKGRGFTHKRERKGGEGNPVGGLSGLRLIHV